eukprot:2808190-Rhodomonas_salina.1
MHCHFSLKLLLSCSHVIQLELQSHSAPPLTDDVPWFRACCSSAPALTSLGSGLIVALLLLSCHSP